jgi:hypothetical protein
MNTFPLNGLKDCYLGVSKQADEEVVYNELGHVAAQRLTRDCPGTDMIDQSVIAAVFDIIRPDLDANGLPKLNFFTYHQDIEELAKFSPNVCVLNEAYAIYQPIDVGDSVLPGAIFGTHRKPNVKEARFACYYGRYVSCDVCFF